MRRLLVGPIVLLLAWPATISAAPAQPAPAVSLTLVSQSAWNGPDSPLRLMVRATNLSTSTYQDLAIELTIEAAARSRSAYDLSLRADATTTLFAYPFAEPGMLTPGETRSFQIKQPLAVLTAREESVIYPLKVELRSGDLSLATLRTPMIFLIQQPEAPLNLEWTWTLSEPMQYGPDDTFVPGSIEGDIAPGGRLRATVAALEALGPTPVDVYISAALVDQLQHMQGGYRIAESSGGVRTVARGHGGAADAATMLDTLRDLARSRGTELMGSPLGEASLPALFESGLASDVGPLLDRGTTLLESTLGRPIGPEVAKPPGGQLDGLTLRALILRGARTILLDPNFLPVANRYSAPPVVRLAGPGGSTTGAVTGVVPDPQVAAVAASYRADPRLAAHATLGELAAIWLELPGTSGRGAAFSFPSSLTLPSSFYGQFSSLVRSSPWLSPVSATEFASVVPASPRRALPAHSYPRLPPLYVNRLVQAKASLGHFRETVEGVGPLADRLRTNLFLAESGTFVLDPSLGLRFIDTVGTAIAGVYRGITITTSVVTLTSQRGYIPLTFQNASGHVVKVVVKFVADRRLRFTAGPTKHITLVSRDRTLTFPVRALVHGRIPFKVIIETSGGGSGPQKIAQRDLIIRSTAYNRLALFVTIGAGVFLLGWWGRRFLPRRRS